MAGSGLETPCTQEWKNQTYGVTVDSLAAHMVTRLYRRNVTVKENSDFCDACSPACNLHASCLKWLTGTASSSALDAIFLTLLALPAATQQMLVGGNLLRGHDVKGYAPAKQGRANNRAREFARRVWVTAVRQTIGAASIYDLDTVRCICMRTRC